MYRKIKFCIKRCSSIWPAPFTNWFSSLNQNFIVSRNLYAAATGMFWMIVISSCYLHTVLFISSLAVCIDFVCSFWVDSYLGLAGIIGITPNKTSAGISPGEPTVALTYALLKQIKPLKIVGVPLCGPYCNRDVWMRDIVNSPLTKCSSFLRIVASLCLPRDAGAPHWAKLRSLIRCNYIWEAQVIQRSYMKNPFPFISSCLPSKKPSCAKFSFSVDNVKSGFAMWIHQIY